MEWKTISTLLLGDRERRSVSIWTVCVCVCLGAFWTYVKRERDVRKRRQTGWGQADPRSTRSPPHPPFFYSSAQAVSALYQLCRLFCPCFRPASSPSPALSWKPPLPLTAHPLQTHHSVCASYSQSQSRSRSCVCRCPWCRCKWSRSEWWHHRTLRQRPGTDKVTGLSTAMLCRAVFEQNANISINFKTSWCR